MKIPEPIQFPPDTPPINKGLLASRDIDENAENLESPQTESVPKDNTDTFPLSSFNPKEVFESTAQTVAGTFDTTAAAYGGAIDIVQTFNDAVEDLGTPELGVASNLLSVGCNIYQLTAVRALQQELNLLKEQLVDENNTLQSMKDPSSSMGKEPQMIEMQEEVVGKINTRIADVEAKITEFGGADVDLAHNLGTTAKNVTLIIGEQFAAELLGLVTQPIKIHQNSTKINELIDNREKLAADLLDIGKIPEEQLNSPLIKKIVELRCKSLERALSANNRELTAAGLSLGAAVAGTTSAAVGTASLGLWIAGAAGASALTAAALPVILPVSTTLLVAGAAVVVAHQIQANSESISTMAHQGITGVRSASTLGLQTIVSTFHESAKSVDREHKQQFDQMTTRTEGRIENLHKREQSVIEEHTELNARLVETTEKAYQTSRSSSSTDSSQKYARMTIAELNAEINRVTGLRDVDRQEISDNIILIELNNTNIKRERGEKYPNTELIAIVQTQTKKLQQETKALEENQIPMEEHIRHLETLVQTKTRIEELTPQLVEIAMKKHNLLHRVDAVSTKSANEFLVRSRTLASTKMSMQRLSTQQRENQARMEELNVERQRKRTASQIGLKQDDLDMELAFIEGQILEIAEKGEDPHKTVREFLEEQGVDVSDYTPENYQQKLLEWLTNYR